MLVKSFLVALTTLGLVSHTIAHSIPDKKQYEAQLLEQIIEKEENFDFLETVTPEVSNMFKRDLQATRPDRATTREWMTIQKEADPDNFGALKIYEIVVPGAHNAGMTKINMRLQQNKDRLAAIKSTLSYTGLNSLSPSRVKNAVEAVFCSQYYSVPKLLSLGARYLDLKVSKYDEYEDFIFVSNAFLSNTLLSQALNEVNRFVKRYPGEIVIVNIEDDTNTFSDASNVVTDAQIAAVVLSSIDSDLILADAYVEYEIADYGGIFLTGFSHASVNTVIVQSLQDESVIDSDPEDLVDEVYSFFDYEFSSADYEFFTTELFVTPDATTVAATWDVMITSAYRTAVAAGTLDTSTVIADVKRASADILDDFDDDFSSTSDVYDNINIISVDGFDEDFNYLVVQANYDRSQPSGGLAL